MPASISPQRKQQLAQFFQQVSEAPTQRKPEASIEVAFEVPDSDAADRLATEETLLLAPALSETELPPLMRMDSEDVTRMLQERQTLQTQEEGALESFPISSGRALITDETIEIAHRVIEKIERREELSDREAGVLEDVILPGQRPVVDIIRGTFDTPAFPFDFLGRKRERGLLEQAYESIGRIELPLDPLRPFGGTGFFIGEGLLLTNRHVALLFAQGPGHPRSRTLSYRAGSAALDMKKEVLPQGSKEAPLLLTVKDILLIHPYWDAAILAVQPAPNSLLPRPLPLATIPPDGPLESRYVVTVGYPQMNSRGNVSVQDQEFRKIYGRKRLLPGLLGMQQGDTRIPYFRYVPQSRPEVLALTHDCSTLTGNSGSAVLDLETGQVVGLHFAGQYLKTNWCVPLWELARDPYFCEILKVASPSDSKPDWLRYWDAYSEAVSPVGSAASALAPGGGSTSNAGPVPVTPAEPIPVSPAPPSSPTSWYEQTDDAALASALRDNPETAARFLRTVLTPQEADSLINDLTIFSPGEPSTEAIAVEETLLGGLLGREADPDLPEIVFLHGIMGGHLARTTGIGGRLWINPLSFLVGDLAEKLSMASDGISDAIAGQALKPDGMIRLAYASASRAWRKAGFVVNEFSFDWRKPIELLADSLHHSIEELALQRPQKKFALVAHSMGGLLCCLYAARHKEPVEEAAAAEEEAVTALESNPAAIRERFQKGAFTQTDWYWVLDGK